MTKAVQQPDQPSAPIRDTEGFTLNERVTQFADAYWALVDHPAHSKRVRQFLTNLFNDLVKFVEGLKDLRQARHDASQS